MSSQANNPTRFTPLQDSEQVHHKFSVRPRCAITTGKSLTHQSFKDECDINRIMARYQATGLLPNLNETASQYLDCTAIDFQAHQEFIAGAFSAFHQMPSAIRSRFNNSPAEFFDFCSQEKNRPELAEMGLLRPITEPVIPNPAPNLSTAQNASNPAAA